MIFLMRKRKVTPVPKGTRPGPIELPGYVSHQRPRTLGRKRPMLLGLPGMLGKKQMSQRASAIKGAFDKNKTATNLRKQIDSAKQQLRELSAQNLSSQAQLKRWNVFYGKARNKLLEQISLYWDALIVFSKIKAKPDALGAIIKEFENAKEWERGEA